MAAKKMKTSERASLITKLTTALKKKYGSKVPKTDRGVLETYMFSACLEDTTDEAAEPAYAKLLESFHDLNEIRVSTVREIERPLSSLPDPEYRAMRIREGLQHVFEKHFAFDLDGLRKKNQDNAAADLAAITNGTPFMKLFTLQQGLGAHVVPLDRHQLDLLVWLGLVEANAKLEAAADEVKSAIRKSDGPLFGFLLRQAANDLAVIEEISLALDDDETPADRIGTLSDLLSGKRKPTKKKAAAKKPAASKASAKKKTAKKKAAAKKPSAKKSAPKKKAATKKTATKTKAPAKKKAAKKKATKKR